jgi:hypothetical protein
MNSEINVFGLLVPDLLIYAVIALAMHNLATRLLLRTGAQRIFWHFSLVDISIFVICLGGIVVAARWMRQ